MSANPPLVIARVLVEFARWRGLAVGALAEDDAVVADLDRTGFFRIRAERPAADGGGGCPAGHAPGACGAAPPDWPGSRPSWLEPAADAVTAAEVATAATAAAPASADGPALAGTNNKPARRCRGARCGRLEILLLAPESPCASSGPELRSVLRRLLAGDERTELVEVFIVAEDAFFAKKNMTNVVDEFCAEYPAIAWHAHRYCNFATCLPEHEAVPPHRILDADEVAALLATYRRALRDLPEISVSDPAAIWLGAREGDVVQIIRDSATASVSCYWRRVTGRAFP